MPFNELVNKEPLYFQITYFGDVSLEDRLAAKARCVDVSHTEGINKFVVDSREIKKDVSEADFIKFAYTFSEIDFPNSIKLALVINDGDSKLNFAKMIISIKKINIRAFTSTEEAFEWLY